MAGPTGVNARTSDGVFPSLGSIQAASYLRAGSVVKNYQDKLDYFISETDEGSNIPITGTTPQLYANPEVTTPGTGETNTASNIGVGDGPFAQKVASDLQFNSESYGYGIESQLLDDTYYRGLNPFIADNSGVFSGVMNTTRSTQTSVINKTGVLTYERSDRPAYGSDGLGCFPMFSNDILYSEDFSNPAWFKTGVTISGNTETSPDLSLTADEMSNASSSVGYSRQVLSIPADSERYFCSAFFKKGTSSKVAIRAAIGGGTAVFGLASYDFDTDTITVLGDVDAKRKILANGWVLLSVMVENNSTNSSIDIRYYSCDGVSASVGDSCFVFGAHHSAKFLSPYQKTEGSSVIVGTEISSIPVNGNLPTPGGKVFFVVDTSIPKSEFNSYIFSTGDVRLYARKRFTDQAIQASITTSDGVFTLSSTPVDEDLHRYVIQYTGSAIELSIDGVLIGSQPVTGVPTYSVTDDLFFGSHSFGDNLNSYLKIRNLGVGNLTTQQITDLGGPDNVIL